MRNRFWYSIVIACTFFSCNHFKMVKKEKPEEILKEEWSKIDTTMVEEPPLFKSCETASEEDQDICFAKTLHRHLSSVFEDQTIATKENLNDTIWLSILIDKNDQILLEDFEIPPYLTTQIPDFKELINERVESLPYLKSATKRGKPVNVRYRLPIVVKSN